MKPILSLRSALIGAVTLLIALLLHGGELAHVRAGILHVNQFPLLPAPTVAKVYYPDVEKKNELAAHLDIWEVHPEQNYFVAMLTPEERARLESEGLRVETDILLTELLNRPLAALPGQAEGIPGYACYRTVEETYSTLSGLAAANPDLAVLRDIGDSWEKNHSGGLPGYDLYALELTNKAIAGNKPTFLLIAETHARELATAETATRFAEYLLSHYNSDPDINWLLDRFKVSIVAMANPDGRKKAEAGLYWRKNTRPNNCSSSSGWGTDLNRNHPFKWGGASDYPCDETYQGPSALSEPESRAIQDYLASLFPDQRGPGDNDPAPPTATGAFITLHSYGRLVLWPWGWGNPLPPNATQLQTFGRKLAYFNNYTPEQSIYLYPTTGTTDDWAYGVLGVASYTIEMGTYFFQDCPSFNQTIYPANLNALLYAFKAARLPYLNPAGPDTININLSSFSVPMGSTLTLSAVADDTRYSQGSGEPVQAISSARASIDTASWQPGYQDTALDAVDGVFNSSTETVSGKVCTAGLTPGRHTIFVESADQASTPNWGVPSAVFVQITSNPAAFSISPDALQKSGDPGNVVTFSLLAHNFLDHTDSYTVQISGNAWTTEVSAQQFDLDSCDEVYLQVRVRLPWDALAGDSDSVSVQVTSQSNPSFQLVQQLTTRTAEIQRLEVVPGINYQGGLPGTTITHTLQVTNTGNITVSASINLSGNRWLVNASSTLTPLGPGQAAILPVAVTIPSSAMSEIMDSATLQLSSSSGELEGVSAHLVTYADRFFNLSAGISRNEGWGWQGNSIPYTLYLQNTGVTTDTYTISVSPGNWTLSSVPLLLAIPGDSGAHFQITHSIPEDAGDGETDQFMISITPASVPEHTLQFPVTTHVGWRAFLPFAHK